MASSRRQQRLQAMGVTPYRLRPDDTAVEAIVPDLPQATSPAAVADGRPRVPCTLLLPEPCAAQDLDRLGRALRAFGADFARAPRVPVPATGLREAPPPARAYLAFGEAQARALGQVLSAAAMREAEVVLLDAPEQLGQGTAKKRLWLAMKALRRRLATN